MTVKVTTPAAFEAPLAAEIVEEPVCASETVLPGNRVADAVPERDRDRRGRGAVRRDRGRGSTRPSTSDALTAAAFTVMPGVVPVIEPVTVSVAVTVCEPAVLSVAEKVWVPASPPVKV